MYVCVLDAVADLRSDSNSEYTPDANEEEEPDEAVATTSSPTTATDSSLRPSRSFSSTMYASHRLDPNLFTSDGDPSLGSDEEAASEAEDALDNVSSSEEDEDEQVDEALPDELAEMTAALDLEKRVRDSSALYGDAELRKMATDGWNVLQENTVSEVDSTADVDALYSGYCGPSNSIMECGLNKLELFFFFLPKTMWQHIASESHRYWEQTLDDRVVKAFIAQPPATQENQRPPSSRERIRAKLNKFQKVQPHELLHWVGLLVARMMAPKKRLADHWSGIRRGVIPQGTFGRVMARDRFKDITRFLHFSNNQDELAKIDLAWKLRPVLATVERTFPAGYILGSRISIDEGMLPCKNRHNPTRTCLKDKPHQWGSKCLMTCCAYSGYCMRTELDVGKKHHIQDGRVRDTKSGPAAVVRYLSCLFEGQPYQGRRVVFADRFYTSELLVQQLRTLGFHYCGTIQKNRLGWCKDVTYSFKKRPK
ncbi:hypothetical protein PR003_g21146 [Phytophthora rubi]|uniref:PiggyBac transposable element-derived protein domain-containing protein n=1 Tax=Phytophthora rubi TaxID=129364 RepID=A0A6A4DGL3_9STRA|nr:hypothetical protein PR003_g21146 [Phytophthora rubi]